MKFTGPGKYLESVFFISADTGFIAGSNSANQGIVMRTTDGGVTWISFPIGLERGLVSVHFPGHHTGYAVGNAGIIKTLDAGLTWNLLPGMTGLYSSVFFTDDSTGYVTTISGNIFRTEDGGITWTEQSTPSCNYLNTLYFPDANTGYAAGDNGAILNIKNGTTSVDEKSVQTGPRVTVYPNPSDGKVTVEIKRGQTDRMDISIFDLQGRQLFHKAFLSNTANLDLGLVAKGLYLLKVQTRQGFEYQKIVLR